MSEKIYDPFRAHAGSPFLIEVNLVMIVNDLMYGSMIPGQIGDRQLICREAQQFLKKGLIK